MSGKLLEDPKILVVFTLPFIIKAINFLYEYYKNYGYKFITIKYERNENYGNDNITLQRAIDHYISEKKIRLDNIRYDINPYTFWDKTNVKNSVLRTIGINKWIKIENGIEMYVGEELKEKSKYSVYTLRALNSDLLDSFIQNSVKMYKEDVLYKHDPKRYMFLYNEYKNNKVYYKNYELINNKTLDSVFFEEKKALQKMLTNFENKSGPYKHSCIQHRLGILLYGPPGTGKTSLIKALSNKLSRHIINIELSKIKTNSELMAIMYNHDLFIGDNIFFKLQFKDIIYVFEDIDAVGSIVHKRSNEESNESAKKLEKDTEEAIKESLKDTKNPENVSVLKKDDTLTLACILNAIDGIIDSPERMIIFTSNHPEKLDPALIRPGRIDVKINLNNISQENLIEMIKFYDTFDAQEIDIIKNLKFQKTPAQIEQFIIFNNIKNKKERLDKFVKFLTE